MKEYFIGTLFAFLILDVHDILVLDEQHAI